MTDLLLLGIDPGSAKAWPVHAAIVASDGSGARHDASLQPTWDIARLDELVEKIAGAAEQRPVLLAIDAPLASVRAFAAPSIATPGTESRFPFNVNAFTTRPCEKALTGRVNVRDASVVHRELVQRIAALNDWTGEWRRPGNEAFVDLPQNAGVSVLGYMGAPHGPVVRHFLDRLRAHVKVSMSVRAARSAEPGTVYVLESHPAVAMAFWARAGRLGSTTVQPYKEGKPGFAPLAAAVGGLAKQLLGAEVSISDDDELDAVVGLLNLVELINGSGSWFGTDDLGYFLVPDPDFGDVWERAAVEG